jgi:hypothetical protein
MRPFRYSSQVLYEFVQERKRIPPQRLVFHDVKSEAQENVGKEARIPLDCDTGRAVILEWVLKAGRLDDITTYHASLLIDSERIRGIDYSAIEQKRRFKVRIPKGWHENVLDPNSDDDRHEPVDLGTVTDFEDFCKKVAKRWNIDYQTEATLL